MAFVLLLATATTFTSCSKEETYSFTVPSASILVSMPGETGYTYFDSANIASVDVVSTPKGWTVDNIDLYNSTITVTAPTTFDNEEQESGTLSLNAFTPIGTKTTISIFLSILPHADIDFSDAPANCYIATQAKTRYKFNAMMGGSSTPLTTERVAILWQTSEELVKYLDMRDGLVRFYIDELTDNDDNATGKISEGNALIAAYDAEDNIIWTWHIWVVNNDPREDIMTLANKSVMNVNLGAQLNSEGSTDPEKILASYGLYYQWGRKVPFVGPNTWDFKSNTDLKMYDATGDGVYINYVEPTAEYNNEAWAEANPTSLLLGYKDNGYDWLYSDHNNTLWSATSKSEQDPCPAGWRVAESSIFESLTITAADDAMAWEEAQPMRGWWLEDTTTTEKHFFTAAGRRNYLDGRLDIMNDDENYPVPWSGYYWTSTTDGADSKTLYFDLNTATRTWNGIDTAHSMHRANALPVRCVRE